MPKDGNQVCWPANALQQLHYTLSHLWPSSSKETNTNYRFNNNKFILPQWIIRGASASNCAQIHKSGYTPKPLPHPLRLTIKKSILSSSSGRVRPINNNHHCCFSLANFSTQLFGPVFRESDKLSGKRCSRGNKLVCKYKTLLHKTIIWWCISIQIHRKRMRRGAWGNGKFAKNFE